MRSNAHRRLPRRGRRSRIAAFLERAVASLERAFDPRQRRLGRRAEVPAADDDRVPAAALGRDGRRAGARDGAPHASTDGRRRHPRPAGRRLSPLRDRRDLARAALREDALRQRPAGARLPPRLAGDGRAALPRRGARHARIHGARPAPATTARSRRARTPTPTAWKARRTSGRPTEIRAVLGDGRRASSWRAYGVDRRTATGSTRTSCRASSAARRRGGWSSGSRPAARDAAWRSASQRPQPARDDKVLAAWNGLAIAAFAEASRAFAGPEAGSVPRRRRGGGRDPAR